MNDIIKHEGGKCYSQGQVSTHFKVASAVWKKSWKVLSPQKCLTRSLLYFSAFNKRQNDGNY